MIWIIGGTKDSRLIIQKLLERSIDLLVTTTTAYGASLLPIHEQLKIKVGKLGQQEMRQLIEKHSITSVIDASHPYAEQVSNNIIEVLKPLDIKLYRYERQSIHYDQQYAYASYDQMIERLKATTGNILLTTGSNSLEFWSKKMDIDRLVVRVLPTPQVINKCQRLGFQPNQLIAIQGPFNKAFNKVLIDFKAIDYLVTKESGHIGGFNAKINAALAMAIEPLVLQRPKICYQYKFDDINTLLQKI